MLPKVTQLRNNLALFVALGLATLMEVLLITSQVNHARRSGHEVGYWAIRMGDRWTSIFAWVVTILVGWVFIALTARIILPALAALIGAVVLVELCFGKILPRPQDSWELALAFALGALFMLWHALQETDFVQNARDRLSAVFGH